MKKSWVLAVMIALFSCQWSQEPMVRTYYNTYLDEALYKEIPMEEYTTYGELLNKIEEVWCNHGIPVIHYQHAGILKKLHVFAFCEDVIDEFRERDVILLKHGDIYKKSMKVNKDSLSKLIQKDLQNNGRDANYARSPHKLIFLIEHNPSAPIEEFKETLETLTRALDITGAPEGVRILLSHRVK
ncbi:MAG: hypothetical protein ACK4FS_08785 [Flavobacterium sp.]